MVAIGSLFVNVGMDSAELVKGAAKVERVIDSTAASLNKLGNNPSLDRLRAKYNPLFNVHMKYKKQQEEIRKAHQLGAISADEMAAAMSRERQSALASIAVIKGRGDAMMNMGNSTRYAAMQQRLLAFQLNDVFVSLAGGMNPLMVFIQQGSQISQIYGPNEGGVGRALRESGKMIVGLVTKFPLITAAVAGSALAVAGLTHEINESTNITVKFKHTALAVFQVFANSLKPITDAISPWFSAAWDKVIVATKATFNLLANIIQSSVQNFIMAWNMLPMAIDVQMRLTANKIIGYLEHILNKFSAVKKLVGLDNLAVGKLGRVSLGRVENPNVQSLAQQQAARVARTDQIMSQDPSSQFFNAVQQRAIANAKADLKKKKPRAAKKTKEQKEMERLQSRASQIFQETRTPQEIFIQQQDELNELLGKGMITWDTYGRAIKRAEDALAKATKQSKSLSDSIADSITNNIQSAQSWNDLGRVAMNVLKDILTEQIKSSTMLKSTGQGIGGFFNNLFGGGGGGSGGGLFSAIGSGISNFFGGSGGGGSGGGLFSSIGSGISNFFGGGSNLPVVVAHSGGIVGSPMAKRAVHPSVFARAPRFHSGGIVGNEVPIIAQKGEGVFTKEQMRAMGGGNVTVNINVSTPDAQSFMRSKGQIAAEMNMAIRRGQRNL